MRFHVDAVQAAGKVPLAVDEIGCQLLSISGHKMHGPQGTGVLFVRAGYKTGTFVCRGAHMNGSVGLVRRMLPGLSGWVRQRSARWRGHLSGSAGCGIGLSRSCLERCAESGGERRPRGSRAQHYQSVVRPFGRGKRW